VYSILAKQMRKGSVLQKLSLPLLTPHAPKKNTRQVMDSIARLHTATRGQAQCDATPPPSMKPPPQLFPPPPLPPPLPFCKAAQGVWASEELLSQQRIAARLNQPGHRWMALWAWNPKDRVEKVNKSTTIA